MQWELIVLRSVMWTCLKLNWMKIFRGKERNVKLDFSNYSQTPVLTRRCEYVVIEK